MLPLLASGRDADVFAIDDRLVLRRYRSPHDTLREGAVMEEARRHGLPVPQVHEVTATDIVLDRITGPTLLEDVVSRPWRARSHARTLAALHHRLHAIPAPEWLGEPVGEGTALLHLDLHPGNVMLARSGPVVIDWANAARGPAEADPALVWLLARVVTIEMPGVAPARISVARRLFLRAFLACFDRERLIPHLAAVGRLRLADSNTSPAERAGIEAMLDSGAY